ncbi:MAG: response regulator [Oscillospiraceae bacterium]|nr:response regulator [Oscillospiraceae bacterium]
MISNFAETLRKLRTDRKMSQQFLANQIHVNRTTVSKWESGTRIPDAAMIYRLSKCFGVDVDDLFEAAALNEDSPVVILVDDDTIILKGSIQVMDEVMPDASIVGFTNPKEALDFAGNNRVALALLDIEMGRVSGLDLCRSLLEINAMTNVVFLTSYREYSFDAWETGACAFVLKPLTHEAVRKLLSQLRHPFPTGTVTEA